MRVNQIIILIAF